MQQKLVIYRHKIYSYKKHSIVNLLSEEKLNFFLRQLWIPCLEYYTVFHKISLSLFTFTKKEVVLRNFSINILQGMSFTLNKWYRGQILEQKWVTLFILPILYTENYHYIHRVSQITLPGSVEFKLAHVENLFQIKPLISTLNISAKIKF